jgi:hypothetical protein
MTQQNSGQAPISTSCNYKPRKSMSLADRLLLGISAIFGAYVGFMFFTSVPYVGRILGIFAGFGSLMILYFVLVLGNQKSGVLKGRCPYCSNELSVITGITDIDFVECSKCKNTVVVKARRFYQVDLSLLCQKRLRLQEIKEGIENIYEGIKIALFLPIAILVSIFFFFPLPILLCLIASVVRQLMGFRSCLQSSYPVLNKTWIYVSAIIQILTIVFLGLRPIGQISWIAIIYPLFTWIGLFALVTFLLKITKALRLDDLVTRFNAIRWNVLGWL